MQHKSTSLFYRETTNENSQLKGMKRYAIYILDIAGLNHKFNIECRTLNLLCICQKSTFLLEVYFSVMLWHTKPINIIIFTVQETFLYPKEYNVYISLRKM